LMRMGKILPIRINLSIFYQFPSLDGRGVGEGEWKEKATISPPPTPPPSRGRKEGDCRMGLKLMRMRMGRIFPFPSFPSLPAIFSKFLFAFDIYRLHNHQSNLPRHALSQLLFY
jgi:hypothetical protein